MTVQRADVVVVGGGHNGLVAGCYLAAAGVDVLVLEQADRLGGGSRTDEVIPGHLFDTHSAAHNIINMTDIPAELRLAEAGLEYREMDPFSVSVPTDGGTVRFWRSVERTVESIREVAPADADRYAAWMRDAVPVVRAALSGVEAGSSRRRVLSALPGRVVASVQAVRRNGGPLGLANLLTQPYGRVLDERFTTEHVKAPVAAFAAHGNASPSRPGSAFFAIWQAIYHEFGQHHAVGGSQGLTDALVRRYAASGGRWRTSAAVARVRRTGSADGVGGRVEGVDLEDGGRVDAPVVLTALDPRVAMLELLRPALGGREGEALAATRVGNTVQALVHLAVDRLPAYRDGRPEDHHGLQSYVDTSAQLADGFAMADAGLLPDDPVPTYAFTPSALDETLAPPGRHTVYLACPSAPAHLRGGRRWDDVAEEFADRMVATVEARAPGFASTVVERRVRHPEQMAAELRWPNAHPMYGDIGLDQLAFFRPTRALASHVAPVRGLFLTGAGTAPVGGVAGSPGRAAAKAVLARHPSLRRR